MDEVRTWSVTYTKHLKQKRKVYLDGFLALYTPSRKVKLYDECRNVLEIKMLKSDEVVKAGETLTFHSHLVDVGDCEGDFEGGGDKCLSNARTENNVKNVVRRFGVRPAKKFRSPMCASNVSLNGDSVKIKVEKDESSIVNPSASLKLIKEFKGAELQKYVVIKHCPVTNESKWVAMYTSQMTKKTKVFHDGYVSLVSSGMRERKIMLYDSRRNILDSRFLKRDELIKSGESMSFDGHIVEIGELEVTKQHDNIVAKEINSTCVKDLINSLKLKKAPNTNSIEVPFKDGSSAELSDNSNISNLEWLVLYTTQLTQRAKKFHDGFLSLTQCESQRKMILYDSSRRLIDSRFLKLGEYICPGESLLFGRHIVDVGESNGNQMFNIQLAKQSNKTESSRETRSISGDQDFVKASETLVRNKHVSNLSTTSQNKIHTINRIPLEEPSPRFCILEPSKVSVAGSSCSDDNRSSNTVPTNKPLRDVSGILSSLQRPGNNANCTPGGHVSTMEHLNQYHFQSPSEKRSALDTQNGEGVLGIRDGVTGTLKGGLGEEFSNQTATSKSGVRNYSLGCAKLESPDICGDPSAGSDTRVEKTSFDMCKVVDSAKNLDVMEDREQKKQSIPRNVSCAYEETHLAKPAADICSKESLTTLSLTEILTCNSSHVLECNEVANPNKDVVAVSVPSDKLLESSAFYMDEWPSFDLGFE